MGNRAVITTKGAFCSNGIGIYLHWNGGRDSVEAFLAYCRLKGYRSPDSDSYGMARLAQVIGNFFGGTTSVGVGLIHELDCDNGDNGTYIIGNDWEIIGRSYFKGVEQHEYDLQEMLEYIDKQQPEAEQLGDYLKAEEIATKDIQIGDTLFDIDYNGSVIQAKVIGFGEDRNVNGHNVNGVPYAYLYGTSTDNPNNYLFKSSYRIKR